ncbi:MAG TPA: hypothetical protein VIT43_00630 [Candidatus Dormibacteraeota bacterium]
MQFAQDAISGLALLELAGANSGQPPQVYDWGGGADTVCQVDREPRTVPDRCFGPTSGPNWSDWTLTSSGWVQRSSGVTGYTVHDGDVEGWTYTSGFGTPPPAARFSQICPSLPAAAVTTPSPATRSSLAATAAAVRVQSAPSLSASTAPTSTPAFQAIAPTVSTPARAALATTGSGTSRPTPLPFAPLALIVVAVASLLGLAVINIRRRAP